MEVEDPQSLIKLCQTGIFPKLPFLPESRDDRSLKDYFDAPGPPPPSDGNSTSNEVPPAPLSTPEREKILEAVLKRFQQDGGGLGGSVDVEGSWWRKLPPKSRAILIIFLSENCDGGKPWPSMECQSLVVKICKEICPMVNLPDEGKGEELGDRTDLRPWFVANFRDSLTHHESDFHHILQLIRVKYNKSEWKYFPASVQGFGWIVKQIPYPFLGNDVDLVIPPALLFTDDYYDDYKMLGLECLSHIVHNVDKSDLTQSNWALVIYDAVMPLCSEKDSAVIQTIMPILMKVLSVIEKDPGEFSNEFTKYDQLLKEIIFVVDTSSDVNLKRTWLLLLGSYLEKLGTATLHWSDKLCIMLRDSTVCNDAILWNAILQVTTTIIKNTWIKPDCKSISEIILRILFNSATFNLETNEDLKVDIIQKAVHCFELLRKCDGFDAITNQLQEVVDQGEANLLHPEFISVLKGVLTN